MTLARPAYTAEHYRALVEDIRRSFSDVPFYSETAASHPVPPGSTDPDSVARWLAELPILSKKDCRRGFPRGWAPRGADLQAALADESVVLLSTSGTTEERVQVLWDGNWWDPQERAAMRRNASVARALATPGYREAILTTPVCSGGVCHIGDLSMEERILDGNLLFLNEVADPTYWKESDLERMADELDRFKPQGLEADPAYLVALASWAIAKGRTLWRPEFVQLSYEMTIESHRSRIARAFEMEPVQIYGASEAGVLFMECENGKLHANPGFTHAELFDVGDAADGAGRLARVVATTLGRAFMPLVRFDLGDVVRVDPAGATCDCGRDDGPILAGVEGRLGDLTWTEARRPVTPATIDRVLAPLAGAITDWQLSQDANGAIRFRVTSADPAAIDDAVAKLATLYRFDVAAERVAAIAPESSGKYRRSTGTPERAVGTRLSRDRDWIEQPVFGP